MSEMELNEPEKNIIEGCINYQLHFPKEKNKRGGKLSYSTMLWSQKYQYWQQFPSMFRCGGKCHWRNCFGNGSC